MATTTNYGWTTPDDTALVKDGASAIRSLGTAVDTTTKALNPSTTLGDIEYRSSTANTNTRLGIGTTGQVLSVSGGVPAWSTISSGGMTLISETVASALSSLSFSSLGSYKQLILNWSGIRHSTTGSAFAIRFNNTSTSSYVVGGIASNQNVVNNVQNVQTSISRTDGESSFPFGDDADNAGAAYIDCFGQLILDNYTSSTKDKSFTCIWSYYDNASAKYRAATTVGMFDGTTAITSIDIFRTAGSATFSNAGDTTIRLYGLQ
jgi:hypothetical protein